VRNALKCVLGAWAAFFSLFFSAVLPAAAQTPVRVVVLSDQDAAHYAEAFAAIEAGRQGEARAALSRVEDRVLVPVAQGYRIARAGSGATYQEATAWLRDHGELAISAAVHDRARDLRPRRAAAPPPPAERRFRVPTGAVPDPPGDTAQARAAMDQLALAMGDGDLWRVLDIAERTIAGPRSGEAAWWGGVAAFRLRDYSRAIRYFEIAATWTYFSPWNKASGYYWAARSRLAVGDVGGALQDLQFAAAYPTTFYGQMALAQLGQEPALDLNWPTLGLEEARAFLDRNPAARRAAALAQIGRLEDAEAELELLHGFLSPAEDRTFLALAVSLQAPRAQLRAAEYGGPEVAAGFCPATHFSPDDGFQVDRAVLFAITRQESRFDPQAVSRSYARGLMQLLASTADDMAAGYNFRRAPTQLYEPGLNMRLGQDYVLWLVQNFHNDFDLTQIFAAYNGGPGWLDRWLSSQPPFEDPLALLESLPRQESRIYAERVLSHMGLCRRVFGQRTLEIEALASGRPALYVPQGY
jgi:soluble lytic murein transglycosylase-like protein